MITIEHEPPRMTQEAWKVRVRGRLIGIAHDKETAELLSGAEACREALRVCLEALDSVRPVFCDSEDADEPGGCDHCTALAAITTARRALGGREL